MRSASLTSRSLQLIGALLLGLLVAGVLFLLVSQPRGTPVKLMPPPSPAPIRIHVAGAVRNPGVYELAPESIVQDAIQAAGGTLPEAEMGNINLAASLAEGQQVHIPVAGEQPVAIAAESVLIPINSAAAPLLEQLPGIGPVLAQSIVEHRERYGPFQRLEDLLEVEGIGPAKLEAIRDLIRIP